VRVFKIEIVGHLTVPILDDELQLVAAGLGGSADSVALLFDVLKMTSYDPPIRNLYIDWHTRNKQRVAKVAVVTDHALWRMVVSTVGMAVRAQVKTFADPFAARDWCAGDAAVANRR
jgi:hypothetical protein